MTNNIISFSTEEADIVKSYLKNGKPGFLKMTDDKISKLFSLYMSGKTHKEISKLEKVKLDIVLYISYDFDWYGKKMKHFEDLMSGMTDKLTQVHLETTNTLNTTISAMNRYFGSTFNSYLQTEDGEVMKSVDTKLLVQYYKAVDTLSKLTSPVKISEQRLQQVQQHQQPLKEPKKAEKVEVKDIKLTDENAGDILKMLAGAKKSEEKS